MSLSAPTPPLLLTKRLTYFLRSNLSPQIHTVLLTTISGKLLAHASSQPVSTLRTQSTAAASIWAIYAAPVARQAISEALPPNSSSKSRQDATTSTVTIQLTGAVFVVRRLRCGLLFVCIGPSPDRGEQYSATQTRQQGQPVQVPQLAGDSQPTPTVGSPSEVESVMSTGAATTASIASTGSANAAGVAIMRRQAEDLARWLDNKLGSLGVPEEGVSIDGR